MIVDESEAFAFLSQKYTSYMSVIIIQSIIVMPHHNWSLRTLESVPLPTMHRFEGVSSDGPCSDPGPCIDYCKYLQKKKQNLTIQKENRDKQLLKLEHPN